MAKAKTKFVIKGVKLVDGSDYVVGSPIDENEEVTVSGIVYNRPDNPYNKGFQLSGASYTVKLAGLDDTRVLVPQSSVLSIVVTRETIEEADPEEIGLPE